MLNLALKCVRLYSKLFSIINIYNINNSRPGTIDPAAHNPDGLCTKGDNSNLQVGTQMGKTNAINKIHLYIN